MFVGSLRTLFVIVIDDMKSRQQALTTIDAKEEVKVLQQTGLVLSLEPKTINNMKQAALSSDYY